MKLMKTSLLITIAFIAFAFTAITTKTVDVQRSEIKWTGSKITGSSHGGSIKLSNGQLEFDGTELKGGSFTFDMNSITVEDLDGKMKTKLEGHLKNEDFFNVEKFPNATFNITSVSKKADGVYDVNGDLIIKDIKNPISFEMKAQNNNASASFSFDRTKYDIRYGSSSFFDSLGDRAINNDVAIEVNLVY